MAADTKSLIVGAVVIIAGTTYVKEAQAGKGLEFRPLLAASAMGIFLTFVAMFRDDLGRNFAALVILVALLRNGNATFAYLGGKSIPKSKSKPSSGVAGQSPPGTVLSA